MIKNTDQMQRLTQQMAFITEVDQAKQIFRQNYVADGSRRENDAEHSWHLALMAFLLAEHAAEAVDVLKVMKMVIIHDLVEIDAGDTYAYDAAGNETKRQRELAAAERIFNLLPQDQAAELRALWDEFEDGQTAEARYASALDHCQPMLLNDASGGKSWREHGVSASQILKRNEDTPKGSPAIWEYQKGLLEKNVADGNIKEE